MRGILPFADNAFDAVFSYGVFQHFSKENTRISLDEVIARTEKGRLALLVQMPNKYGIRQYQQHRRRGFHRRRRISKFVTGRRPNCWNVRDEIRSDEDDADCYFGLGIQATDADLLPLHYRIVVNVIRSSATDQQ